MCQPVGTQTNLEEDVDTVKAATGLNNQKNTVQFQESVQAEPTPGHQHTG